MRLRLSLAVMLLAACGSSQKAVPKAPVAKAPPPASALPAPAPSDSGPSLVERDGFRITFPAGWDEVPELARAARKAAQVAAPELDAEAIAYTDKTTGVVGVLVWLISATPLRKPDDELAAFHQSLRSGLEKQGAIIESWDMLSSPGRVVSTLVARVGEGTLRGRAVATVDRRTRLRAFMAQCMATPSSVAGERACEQMLRSFEVTLPGRTAVSATR